MCDDAKKPKTNLLQQTARITTALTTQEKPAQITMNTEHWALSVRTVSDDNARR